MKLLVLLIVVVVVGAGVADVAVPVSAQQATSIDAPVWSLGDHWTWQFGKDQISNTVAGTTGGYAVRYESGSDTSMTHYNADFSSPDAAYLQYQFPLTIGKTWSYEIEGTYNGRAVKWVVQRKVEAMETVTVPAGTFDAVRISGHHCNTTLGGCADFIVWYAPKVKNAVKASWSASRYWPLSRRGVTQVLVSYQFGNP